MRGGGRGAQVIDAGKTAGRAEDLLRKRAKSHRGTLGRRLKAPVKLFGRDMTKEEAVRFLFGDQHEHLGQSIAYARSNGVVPPWSK